MFKIPMQFLILFIGVMVFVFYLFNQPPVFFNQPTLEQIAKTPQAAELVALEARFATAFEQQRAASTAYVAALDSPAEPAALATLESAAQVTRGLRVEAKALVKRALPEAESKDADYVFISFVLAYLPSGLVGLLIAVILCAAMSSTASELSALGSTSMLDLYKRVRDRKGARPADPRHDLRLSRVFTILWGLIAVGFAAYASLVDNLIEAVNILGSIFYGTMLGLFVTAFFLKRITAGPVLIGAIVAQTVVATLFFMSDLGFLWFNVIGCGLVMVVSSLAQLFVRGPGPGGRKAANAG
jgi:SSS family solute:Na+ symporter